MVLHDEHLGFLVISTTYEGMSTDFLVKGLVHEIAAIEVAEVLCHRHVNASEHVLVDDALQLVYVMGS